MPDFVAAKTFVLTCTGAGGSGTDSITVTPNGRWYQVPQMTTCSTYCRNIGLANIRDAYGANCASGETPSYTAYLTSAITYPYGCWNYSCVDVASFIAPQRHPNTAETGTGYCYPGYVSASGGGYLRIVRDNDATDQTSGCFCGLQLQVAIPSITPTPSTVSVTADIKIAGVNTLDFNFNPAQFKNKVFSPGVDSMAWLHTGGTAVLSWTSTGAAACEISGLNISPTQLSGSITTGPLGIGARYGKKNYVFQLTCTGANGQTATDEVYVAAQAVAVKTFK